MKTSIGVKQLALLVLAFGLGAIGMPARAAFPDLLWKVEVEAIPLGGGVAPDGSVRDAFLDTNCIGIFSRDAMSGDESWHRYLCGPDKRIPAFTINVGGDGSTVVLYRFQTDVNMYATKLDSSGTILWNRAVTEQPFLTPTRAALDPAGGVFFVGVASDTPQRFLAKMDGGTGVVSWRANFDFDPVALAADSAGNAIVGERGQNSMAAVAKREPVAGAIVWRRLFDNAGYQNFPNALGVDRLDDVVVTGGLVSRPGDTAFTTMKLAGADGRIYWRKELADGISTNSFGTGLAIAANGDVVVAGTVNTAKYLADGSLQWQVNGLYMGNAMVAIDPAGDAYVTGAGEAGTQSVIRTVKYARDDGTEIWSTGYADQPGRDAFPIGIAAPASGPVIFGSSKVVSSGYERVLKYSSAAAALANFQGLWWNSPANSESGWGLNIAHQGDILFLTWFTYDQNSEPMWLLASDVRRVFGLTYYGKLYRATGPAFDSVPFNPAAVQLTEIGTVYVDFTDNANGTFTYNFASGGPISPQLSGSKAITRMIFDARVPTCVSGPAAGERAYQDLWWAAPAGSESGWGVNITHQGDILFATWFTYDSTGRGMWIVGSRMEKTAPGTYAGPLYRTRGATFASKPWPAITITQVGNGTFTFPDPDHGTFAYTVDGKSQTKSIVRMHYADPPTTCVFTGP